jgi:hypothetical protein
MSRAWVLAPLLALSATGHAQKEPALELSDFAFSQALTPTEGRALQTVLVPVEAYRGALRKSLADLRVFDPAGNEVPHAIRTLARPAKRPPTSSALPIFPLRETAPEDTVGDLAIHIERNAEGEVIDIRSPAAEAAPEQESETEEAPSAGKVVSYILDARAVEDPIVALTVTIAETARDYVLPIRVEASSDLAQWRAVAVTAPLARLDFEGNRIEHDELDLQPTQAKYLRLSWPGHELPGDVAEVVAEAQPAVKEPTRVSVTLVGEPSSDEPGVYVFDAGGFVPADRVHVRLPEANTLVKAALDATDDEAEGWSRVASGRFYRIVDDGQEVQQPAVTLPRSAPRFWRLEVTAGRKELGADPPELTLSFYPDQILFVARGPGEHTLAYGSYKASASGFEASDLVELTSTVTDAPLPRATAALGAQKSVSGASALEEPPPPPPLRTYLLWAILVVSVTLLAAFALRLFRQQR